ncbi:MAG UNVERIFIED_CONTAM: DNA repair protein RecO [Planctomycetaceae bacterium]
MSLEKAEALVIRQVDFSESSRVVTFFSREFGRFSALAKGAKRLKGPFDAALDLLSECRVVFIRKSSGSLNLLTEARLNCRFQPQQPGLTDGLIRLYAGYYAAELLNGLTEEFDPHSELFDLTAATLRCLESADCNPGAVVLNYEIKLLMQTGVFPNLTECAVCGAAVELTGRYAHWVSQGGLLCAACRSEEFAGSSVSAVAIEILRRFCELTTAAAGRIRLTPQQLSECHRLSVSAIVSVLGRKPQTLRYLPFAD